MPCVESSRFATSLRSSKKKTARFDFFPKLPAEVRFKIYKQACYGRVVIWGTAGQASKLPAVVYTCKESYIELRRKYYPITIASCDKKNYTVYVNSLIDILYRKSKMPRDLGPWTTMLDNHFGSNMVNITNMSWDYTVRYLAIRIDHVEALFDMPGESIWCLSDFLFPLLQEVHIICGKSLSHGMRTGGLRIFRKKRCGCREDNRHWDKTSQVVRRMTKKFGSGLERGQVSRKIRVRFVELCPNTEA